MTAAGTSHIACLVSGYWIEKIAKIPVACKLVSEYRYREPVTAGLDTAIAILQSKVSLDNLKAMQYATESFLTAIALVNVADSTIERESDKVLVTKAGPEIGVASTKAFCNQTYGINLFGSSNRRGQKGNND